MPYTCDSCGLPLRPAQTFQRGELMVCLDCAHKRDYTSEEPREERAGRACAVCGQPAGYLFAYPARGASVEVVYDGAPVCSPECARALLLERGRAEGAE